MTSARKSSQPVHAVIFDLDGILVSSIPIHFEAFRRTFAAEGKDFSFEEYMDRGAGASREVLIRQVMGELPPEKLAELMDAKEHHVRKCILDLGLEVIPDAREFVEAVQARGLETAVATGSRTPVLLLESAGMKGLFETIVDRGQIEHPKPHPETYVRTARLLGVEPPNCLVIEDSPAGVEAARSAAMRVIALTTSEPADRLQAADAIYPGFKAIDLDEWLG